MAAAVEPIFKNLQEGDNTLAFQLSPTHVAYANTLRRLCMVGVETVGFRADMNDKGETTDVKIYANSTPMTNEMLAHRVGLIPLFVEKPLEWTEEKHDKYKFVLSKTNTTNEFMPVFARDFQVVTEDADGTEKRSPSTQFFSTDKMDWGSTLIAILKPQTPGSEPETIHIEARASQGLGRENARFIPTCQCAYAYTREKDEAKVREAFISWAQKGKKGDIEALETSDPEKVQVLRREFETLEINRCYLKDEKGEPYSFDFTIESVGQLTPKYIVARALEAGKALCDRYKGALPPDVVVQTADCKLPGAYDFIFQRQDHTLGHLIQAWIDGHLMDGPDAKVAFCGYDIPHPLRDEMVIRIAAKGYENNEATAREALAEAMGACSAMFADWYAQWSSAAGGRAPVAAPAAAAAPKPTGAKKGIQRPAAPTASKKK